LGCLTKRSSGTGEQLSTILDHFQVLNEIDTDDVPPTAQSLEPRNVTSATTCGPRITAARGRSWRNAPRSEDGYLRVRAVLD
jgi:aspartyl-tRNA(Asn)/glutamyl-tRNA(Gln) amidotransferase subunit C